MSAKWMRVETDFVDHPKTFRLAALLNEPLAEAYVLRAWTFLSRFCPTGHVRDTDGTALEAACRWRGQPGALLDALVKTEWLEVSPGGGWEAHDWGEHQGKVAQRAAKERERKRAYRERKAAEASASVPPVSHGTSAGHPAQRDVTGRDVTGRDVEKKQPAEAGPLGGSPAFALLTAPVPDAVETLRGIWNEHRAEPQPEWREMGAKRRKAAQARVRERSLDEWEAVVKRIAASAFCRGENERGWRADPDFLLRPDTAAKVLEGKYDDRRAQGRGPVPAEATDWSKQPTGEMPF